MACRPYNTGRCLLLRLFNPSKLWGSLQYSVTQTLRSKARPASLQTGEMQNAPRRSSGTELSFTY